MNWLIFTFVAYVAAKNANVLDLNSNNLLPPKTQTKRQYEVFRAPGYLPEKRVKIELCPNGLLGSPPNCYEPCPLYTTGRKPNCQPIKCPAGWDGDFQPNCDYKRCPNGEVGIYPNCYVPKPYVGCPSGQIGSPPNDCYVPCPAYYYGRPPNCTRVRCPDGWIGEFQPDCKREPTCLAGETGVWPDCQREYCPADSVDNYPNEPRCKCKPGLEGVAGSCSALTTGSTYLPPTFN